MKMKQLVTSIIVTILVQTVNADCETAQSIGATGGGATGAFVGGTLGLAVVGATTTCAASLATAPFTFGLSALFGCAGAFGAARIAGRVIGGAVGEKNGEQLANIICDSQRNMSFKVGEIVFVDNFKGVIVDTNHKRKRVRLMVLDSGHLLPVELDVSRIAKLK